MKKIFLSAVVMLLMSSAAVYADGNKPAKHKAPKQQTTCTAKNCKPTADCKPGTKCPTKPGCVCH